MRNRSKIKDKVNINSKKENEILTRVANNKLLLFLIPNLICWYPLFYYYNQNVKLILSVFFYEVIVGCLVFLGINTLVYFLLEKILKNKQKVFCVMCIIAIAFSIKMNMLAFIIFLIVILITILDFKYLINFSLDSFVSLISFITVILFSFSFIISIFNAGYIIFNSKSYNYEMEFKVDKDKETPNIYWIHCDGMMNATDIKKYFGKEFQDIKEYFNDNDYYYNDEASFSTGYKTSRSLAALFNPYYYDNFYKDYLEDLDKQLLGKKRNTDFIVNYYELEDKKLNNELFTALKEKDYETIAIGDYNVHTAFYTDHYYDYYHYLGLGNPKQELRHINKKENSELGLKFRIRLTHNAVLFTNTMLYHVANNINLLNYESVDYSDFDFTDYNYTKNTSYWYSKAIFKALDDSYSKDKSQFTFVDYKLYHYPTTYNSQGGFLTTKQQWELNSYFENYVYASKLLFEMLDYIQEIDKNAVIIVQSDHGLHTFENEVIMNELDINNKDLLEIRNSVMNAVYVPKEYQNNDEDLLNNPLNISRYLVNNFIGENYEYID